jgi:hypothetical protein
VLRIDLDAARRLFGPAIGSALQLGMIDPARDAGTAGLVSEALARAEVVWVAVRPGLPAQLTDNVVALRGRFADIDPRAGGEAGWGAPADLGAGFRLYERPPPTWRSAPVRIYARGEDWLVFVSSAEVDAAERAIEEHARDPALEPADRGIVSVAARVEPLRALLAPSYPAVAEALALATRLDGAAEADDRGLRLTLDVQFSNERDAAQARDRSRLLLGVLTRAKGVFGTLARGASAGAVASTLVVRVELDGRGLADLVGCLGRGESC